ncbi:hypothetical protein BDP27DRAFT_1322452, partial [Rhodocollybia butyracea]
MSLGVTFGQLFLSFAKIIGMDEELLTDLCRYIRGLSFNGETFPWPSLCQGLARRSIQI